MTIRHVPIIAASLFALAWLAAVLVSAVVR